MVTRTMWTRRVMPWLLLPAGLVLVSCNEPSSPDVDARAGAEQARVGETFQLALGESHRLADGTRVTFPEVLGESRCPVDVTCVWAGEAKVRLGLTTAGTDEASVTAILGGGGRADSTKAPVVEAEGYEIQILQLDPYPNTHETQTTKHWVAHLRVKRL